MQDAPKPSAQPSPRVRRLRLALKILLPVLSILLLEGALRLADFVRGADIKSRTHWYWAYEQDRFLGYRPRANTGLVLAGGKSRIDTNSQGYRDAESDLLPFEGRRLIVCIGESSTFGVGGSSQETSWPNRLEALLREQADPAFVVLNAGVPGYTTVENLQLLKLRLLKHQPEAVIYMGFRNDFVEYGCLDSERDFNMLPRRLAALPNSALINILMRSSLVGLALTRWGAAHPLDGAAMARPAGCDSPTTRGLALLRDQVALMAVLSQRHGAKLLWVDQPIDYEQTGNDTSLEITRAALHGELAEQGVPLLEAHTLYDFRAVPLLDDVHFSDEGNQRLAEILLPQVIAALEPPQGE